MQDSPGAAQLVVVGLFADDALERQHTSKVEEKTTGGKHSLIGYMLLPTHPSSIPRGKRVFPHGAGDLGQDGRCALPLRHVLITKQLTQL